MSKSRYANMVYYFDKPEDLPGIIREYIPRVSGCKPIIICCDDPLQSVMDCHYDDFKDDYILSDCSGKQGKITHLMDKKIQMDIARQCGVCVPRTWIVKKNTPVPADMTYPCIAKPEISIAGSKSQIRVCLNKQEILAAISERDYLIQEFIDKDVEIIIWGTSIGDGKYYMPGVARKLRQYPDDNSLSSYGVLEGFDSHPNLDMHAVTAFLRAIRYTGMFSIEMAIKDNTYYLLEINLRNDGKQYFSTAAGANLPLLYINSRIGKKFVEPVLKLPSYFMGETTDIKQILRKKVSLTRWLVDLLRTKSFFIMNFRAPLPFVYQLIGKIKSHLS